MNLKLIKFLIIFTLASFLKTHLDINFINQNSSSKISNVSEEYFPLYQTRNIAFGLDNIPDEEDKSSYFPSLYSIILKSSFNDQNPFLSYLQAKKISIVVNNLVIAISFLIISITYKVFEKDKYFISALFFYLSLTTLSSVTGFYNLIAAENMFIPLIIFIYSLLVYAEKKVQKDKCLLLIISIIIFIAFLISLTHKLGIFTMLSLIPCLFILAKQSAQKFSTLNFATHLVLPLIIFYFLAKYLLISKIYTDISRLDVSSVFNFFSQLINFKYNFKNMISLSFNQIIYILFGSFIFPIILLIKGIRNRILKKDYPASLIFVLLFILVCFIFQFTSNIFGYNFNSLTREISYRYLDPAIILLYFHSFIQLLNYFKSSKKIQAKNFVYVLSVIFIFLFIFVLKYHTSMFVGLNNFGITWLRITNDTVLIILLIILLIYLIYYLFLNKSIYLAYLLLILIFLINVSTYSVNAKAIKNDSTLYNNLVPILQNLNLTSSDYLFYVRQIDMDRENSFLLTVYYYYLKWYLSYFSKEQIVIHKFNEYSELSQNAIILISGDEYRENKDIFDQIHQFHPNYALATLKNEV